jgi:hypothetical protein
MQPSWQTDSKIRWKGVHEGYNNSRQLAWVVPATGVRGVHCRGDKRPAVPTPDEEVGDWVRPVLGDVARHGLLQARHARVHGERRHARGRRHRRRAGGGGLGRGVVAHPDEGKGRWGVGARQRAGVCRLGAAPIPVNSFAVGRPYGFMYICADISAGGMRAVFPAGAAQRCLTAAHCSTSSPSGPG